MQGLKLFLELTGGLVWICVIAVLLVVFLSDNADENAAKKGRKK